ncbi:MAG: tRNA (adenosine(37)-N6)-threonylcarbamoyltransferase complex ATPase subunit type 1 TsaE [Holosporaceae bacterium]|jgi:tRNA threonylcarbamoyladenosine biosynthesis protein TsaE|nr:tRNA (adenosine(37)-N6)-threonylcarbamoyltransferase complex ATPase subunit type 1 TsaE [Holosporaceae bacterium]
MKFVCNTLQETQKAAEYLARAAKPGFCLALFGDLGYGKTTFAKYFIKSLNRSVSDVPSPTFTIIQTYDSPIAEIWHVDCYRLKSKDEFYNLGLEDALRHCITIIEWPEVIMSLLPIDTVKAYFSYDGNIRQLFFRYCRS